MSKRTDRIVRDLSQASFKELLLVASRLHEEFGGAAVSFLLSVLSQSGGLPKTDNPAAVAADLRLAGTTDFKLVRE